MAERAAIFIVSKASFLGSAPAAGGTRTNVNLFANMTNAFNRPNYNQPSGVMTSRNFGRSTSRAGRAKSISASDSNSEEALSPDGMGCQMWTVSPPF